MLEPELRQELKDLINEVLDEREHERKLNVSFMISPKKIKTIGDRCLRQKSQKKSNLTKMRWKNSMQRCVKRCGCQMVLVSDCTTDRY